MAPSACIEACDEQRDCDAQMRAATPVELDGEERRAAKRWKTPASSVHGPGIRARWSEDFANRGDTEHQRNHDPQYRHPRHRQGHGSMVRRDHLHGDDVLERRFAWQRLFVLEVMKVPAMDHAVIVILRDVGMHGVERHQRKAESHEGNYRKCEATHAESLSPARWTHQRFVSAGSYVAIAVPARLMFALSAKLGYVCLATYW